MTIQQTFEFPRKSVMTFETFVPCDGNSGALHFARKIVDLNDSEKLLYIHGPSGSGKSHLLSSIATVLKNNFPDKPIVIHSSQSVAGFTELRGDAPLLIDDLHLFPDIPELRAALWQCFNDCYQSALPIVVSGLCPPRELPNFDDHLISRLLWGLVARSDASDDTSRRMILKKIAEDRNVRIPDDVIDSILATTSREVGNLIEVFEKLYSFSLSTKRKITVSLLRQSREQMDGTLL